MFQSKRSKRGIVGLATLWVAKSALIGLFVFVGCGPIGPIPGGALRGEVGPTGASDWSFAEEIENAQLESRPEDPHSVNTWFAAVGPQLYVPTSMILGPRHPDGRSWVANVAVDDRVRIRLGGTVFERRAIRVRDGSMEYRAARDALESRYEVSPAKDDPDRVIWIFRLDPR